MSTHEVIAIVRQLQRSLQWKAVAIAERIVREHKAEQRQAQLGSMKIVRR